MAVDLINMLYSVTGHKFKVKGRPLCDTTRNLDLTHDKEQIQSVTMIGTNQYPGWGLVPRLKT